MDCQDDLERRALAAPLPLVVRKRTVAFGRGCVLGASQQLGSKQSARVGIMRNERASKRKRTEQSQQLCTAVSSRSRS